MIMVKFNLYELYEVLDLKICVFRGMNIAKFDTMLLVNYQESCFNHISVISLYRNSNSLHYNVAYFSGIMIKQCLQREDKLRFV